MSYRVVNLYEVWCDGVRECRGQWMAVNLRCDRQHTSLLSGSYSRDMHGLWACGGRQH